MSYATDDFKESLYRTDIKREDVARVVRAWGHGEGMGNDAGHYGWTEDSATDWNGGFLLELAAGGFAYIEGWCDYTGWGCQDGVYVSRFKTLPEWESLNAAAAAQYEYCRRPPFSEWDEDPADLNRWLRLGDRE